MTEEETRKCEEWVKAHHKHWQTYRRGNWQYRWKGKTLVRYLDNVSMRELQDGLLLEYLCSPACMDTLSLYSQDVDGAWTPVNAWYESMPMRPPNTGMAQVRLYHALKTDVEEGGDGPYTVENGCMWKVDWQFFWKQTEVASLPESSSGVNYRITNLNRDDEDGTFSYVLERRERVQQDIAPYVAETDVFSERTHEEHLGVKGDTSEGGKQASCADGTKTTRTVRKNEDCTHDVINDTVEEKKVVGAVEEVRATMRGRTVTKVNRGMPSKAPTTGVGVGESVRNEKTEAGRWNQTITTHDTSEVGYIRQSCSKTKFRHEHSETGVTETDPGFTHVEEVSEHPGEVVEKVVARNDEGTFDVTESVRTDNRVDNADVTVRKTLSGTVKSVTHRNRAAAASTVNLPIGSQVRNSATDSGLYDVTIESADAEDVGKIAEECVRTASEHRHSETSVVAENPGPVDAPDVADGTIVDKSVQVTDAGGYRTTTQRRVAIASETGMESGSVTRNIRTVAFQNSEEVPEAAPSVNVDVEVSARRNEFGRYDGTKSTVTHMTRKVVASSGSVLVGEKVTDISHDANPRLDYKPEVGKTFSASAQRNDSGSVDVRVVERTAVPRDWDVEVDLNMSYMYTVYFRNYTVEAMHALVKKMETDHLSPKVAEWSSGSRDPSSVSITPYISMNEFGLLDGNVQFHASWAPGSAGQYEEIGKVDYEYTLTHMGEGASKAVYIAKGRGLETFKEATRRTHTGAAQTLHVSFSYNESTQCWTYEDSICHYDKNIT